MSQRNSNRLAVVAALVMGSMLCTAAMGEVIVYQEGSVLLDDTQQDTEYTHLMSDIRSDDPDTNRGTDDRNVVGYLDSQGEMRIVMDFALDHIPAGSIIDSVSLDIKMPQGNSSGIGSIQENFDVNLFEVTADMTEDEVTWNDRTAGNDWNTDGGDFDPTILSTINIDGATDGDTIKTFASSADFVTAAQDALDNSHKLRLILIGDPEQIDGEEFFRVRTDDEDSLADRPALSVTFVPEPATMSLLALGGLGVLLRKRRR